jgi:hypothetical protein
MTRKSSGENLLSALLSTINTNEIVTDESMGQILETSA